MRRINLLVVIIMFLISCEGKQGEVGPMGLISLINIESEPAGDNCLSGGSKIESGIDINSNGVLDLDEIQSTKYICNGIDGSDGQNSLINVTEELSGDNCTSGGLKIEVGIDTNNNGILDLDEIQSTQHICNGDGATELRYDFNFMANTYWYTTSSEILSQSYGIPDFNISNFLGVDSIILGAYIKSKDVNTNCTLELYDFTNGSVIENSSISTNSNDYIWVTTDQNFLESFPDESIDLRLRLSSDNGSEVDCSISRLILKWE